MIIMRRSRWQIATKLERWATAQCAAKDSLADGQELGEAVASWDLRPPISEHNAQKVGPKSLWHFVCGFLKSFVWFGLMSEERWKNNRSDIYLLIPMYPQRKLHQSRESDAKFLAQLIFTQREMLIYCSWNVLTRSYSVVNSFK